MGRTVTLIERGAAALLGGALLYCQMQLVQSYYNSDNATLKMVVPLFSIALAIAPSAIHRLWKERLRISAVLLTGIAAFTFLISCSSTLARVSEFRAAKGSGAAAIAHAYAEAKAALQQAEDDEKVQAAKVDQFCSVTTTSQTYSKKARTDTKIISPLCAPAQTELERRQGYTTSARRQLAAVPPVPEADADIKGLAALLQVSPALVDKYWPAGMPLGLEFIMWAAFLVTFRPMSYPIEEEAPRRPAIGDGDNVTVLEGDDVLLAPQEYVNACVAKWIDEQGLPVGLSSSQARAQFNAWLRSQETVSPVRFGKALTALGVKKRKLGGRVMIADQPVRRAR